MKGRVAIRKPWCFQLCDGRVGKAISGSKKAWRSSGFYHSLTPSAAKLNPLEKNVTATLKASRFNHQLLGLNKEQVIRIEMKLL